MRVITLVSLLLSLLCCLFSLAGAAANKEAMETIASRKPRPQFAERGFFVEDMKTTCPLSSPSLGVYLRWTAEAGSGSFAPPLIYDLGSDGRKEIINPTFTHYVEALDGETGRDVLSWPFAHPRLKTQASPLVVDIEPDGTGEIMISTYYGELLFFTEEGTLRRGKTLRLPRIIVKRNWSNDFSKEDKEEEAALEELEKRGWRADKFEKLHPEEAKKMREAEEAKNKKNKDGKPAVVTRAPETVNRRDIAVRGNAGGFIKRHEGTAKEDKNLDDSVVVVVDENKDKKNKKQGEQHEQQPTPESTAATVAAADPIPTPAQQQQQDRRPLWAEPATPEELGNRKEALDFDDHGKPLDGAEPPREFEPPVYPPAGAGAAAGGGSAAVADDDDEYAHGKYFDHDIDDYDTVNYYGDERASRARGNVKLGAGAPLSPEAKRAMNLAFHKELFEAYDVGEQKLSSVDSAASDPFARPDDLRREHQRMYIDPHTSNVEEDPKKDFDGRPFDPKVHVYLQPHILATPVVADIDMDGKFDVIVPVSYYLDSGHPGAGNDPGLDTALYVVSELVCINLADGKTKWRKRLRMSTKRSRYPAYMLASPVVIDVDNNVLLDIVITTSDGMINVFDYRGNPHQGWPVQMRPIHGPALVEDVNGDRVIDICAGDASGTIACFSNKGNYMWDRWVTGEIADGMTAGDVNGDGILDIVVGTTTGQMWALSGINGETLPNFPIDISPNTDIVTGGDGSSADAAPSASSATVSAIVAPPLLINLNDTMPPWGPDRSAGLHIVFPATDGNIYFVSGTTGCTEIIDLGHASYTQILADDLIGNGKIALVVTTLSGALHVLETKATYTPLKAWPSRPVGLNGYTARENRVGIMVREDIRRAHDVQGESWTLIFDIVDDRSVQNKNGLGANMMMHTYYVIVTYGRRMIAFGGIFHEPGMHKITIPAPPERLHTMVHVFLRVPGGQIVEDSFAMSFNAHVLDTAKFILVLPFLLVMAGLCVVKKEHEISAPTTMHGTSILAANRAGAAASRNRRPIGADDDFGFYIYDPSSTEKAPSDSDDYDEVDFEEFMLALERERLMRALRAKGMAAGRYGAQAAAAPARRPVAPTAAAASSNTSPRRAAAVSFDDDV